MIKTSSVALRKSSVAFGNFGKCSEKIVWPSEQLRNNFWRIFGNLRKVFANLRKIVKKWMFIYLTE